MEPKTDTPWYLPSRRGAGVRNATLEYLAAAAGAHRDRVAARYGPGSAQLRAAEEVWEHMTAALAELRDAAG